MRIFTQLITLLIAVLLASCGGGGGSPGLSLGPTSTFVVQAPTTLTLGIGSTQQYTIQGGVKPYSVFSTNPAVVTGWLIGDSVVAVGAVASGAAQLSVQDAKGAIFSIAVTAGTTAPFFTNMPASFTLAPGPFGSQTYKLGGGVPPYKAVSSFPSLVSVVVNGTDVTVTALQLPGVAQITLSDSASPPATLSAAFTAGTVVLAINPSSVTMPVGSTLRAVITGGTPPYHTIVLDNCSTNAQIVNGNILVATASQACTGTAITVVDANNQTASLTLTLGAGPAGLNLAPTALSIPESNNTPNLTLLVYGATGAIQVFSTNNTILAPQPPVNNGDGTWTIALAGGNTCSLAVTPGSPAIPATVGPPPTTFVAAVPATGGDRTGTITVIDSTGRQGNSVWTVKDTNGVGGCSPGA